MVSATATPAPTDASCTVPGAETAMVVKTFVAEPAPSPAAQAAASSGRSPLTKSQVEMPFDQMLTWSTVTPPACAFATVEANHAGKTGSSCPAVAPASSPPNGLLCSLAKAMVSATDQP